ncbi:MarR family winged helix-turn-helix transcriptional regulator [Segnochrobactrum spirostomi]|uniref:MarR family transcriptional regulator n=1 Tax=Segnochrobactrum spirostomi TaxID=2608987 RepID=A0A6A7Y3T7_9HYPH|nr:MarR family transcriptional regulator [Segnochrobactrum spirostomi]MQT13773.1 MarR family transcriptional regulator [Segnochrobactrum spirostomi]
MPDDASNSTRPDARSVPTIDELLCFAIYSAEHAFTRAYRPLLSELGLTYPQFLIMTALWEADALTMKVLGERLRLDSGTLTPLLKRLEAAGLVRRARNRDDERVVDITLTDEGRALKDRSAAIWEHMIPAVGLCREDIDTLRSSLGRLRERLDGIGEVEG